MPAPSLRLAARLLPVLLAACSARRPAISPGPDAPPPVLREFRGVWIASVSNIDWPSRPGLPVAGQQAELLRMLNRAAELRLNAVILQVRPMADALYASPLEPWSEYLTGEMGRAPEPLWDPLAFAVQEAHRRGMELHAWFNPYRARHTSARSAISADHISRTHPELVRPYGKQLWMDPGEAAVQDRTTEVILDVVRRYDVDGVHIDDYFYPYGVQDSAGAVVPFPDEPSWTRYQREGGTLARDDWRRQNVDQLVERLHREIRRAKPWVKFGISPFGIWRPGSPPQIRGYDAYEKLYADSRKWLRQGWADYFTPQLYWPIAQTEQSYPVLLRWWAEQNPHGRNLWPGNFTNRVGDGERGWPASELVGQIYVTRGQPGATGNVHFSMRVLMANPDSLVEKLEMGAYAEPALIPASPWLGDAAPGPPHITLRSDSAGTFVALEPVGRTLPTWWTVRVRRGSDWTSRIVPGWMRSFSLPDSFGVPDKIVVSGVDRTGNAGAATTIAPAPSP